MMKKSILLLMFGVAVSFNASALDTPKSSHYDQRMQYINYNPNDVVEIRTKNGFVTAVTFAEDEEVTDIASGFSDGWEVKDNKNNIYIKPKAVQQDSAFFDPKVGEWDTNLLIATNKRTYAFDLKLVEELKDVSAYFMKFAYPTEEQLAHQREEAQKRRVRAEAQAKIRRELEEKEVNATLDKFTIPKNWDYTMKVGKDSREIAPRFVYDDGIRTYIGFDTTNAIPAVFYYQGETEMMSNLNPKMQGQYTVLIVHKTAHRFILRSGDQVVGIINHGFGKNPNSSVVTTNQGVIRQVK
ncbi:P-type conjugative transfer protein VirB9 [Aggregatibacter actinomycetemcomitans]|uniref:P-type conjugative transfer protein VirB9 n=3 Tax=Aggregatibacter actinomycetemcomitans TaxID=714 RepID=UPI00077E65E0|nr:P-type conjugative transfer protein VirB9 [Aggregatibacter actinomycetemcomitans]KYK72336.1 hypothetical protein SA3096_10520 [Aggregatibacter actinomycetemcomitans serotype e str. SA3096]KYK80133.1 hypothetical protein SC936_06725 [Aggregatibacter actinomycetemcomitans serotype e str. SC936]MBN6078455.1 P-type conjugative transfer protein VirB9 [Aggregatibacter actinomycetemcomitans]MBN6078473.1 P-type conjugative transfer protein VirB9 [Aggregatibacter actinomycetemcomitans]MBN6078856.1 P